MTGGFDEETLELRDLVRGALARECSIDRLRSDLDGTSDPRERWSALAALGIFGATVPEEFGGLGFDEATLVLIAEELGYAAVPEPVIETVSIVVPILARYAPRELQEEWLPRIAAGDVIATAQLDGMPTASYGQFADVALLGGIGGLRIAPLGDGDRDEMPSEDFARHPATITATGIAFTNDSHAFVGARARGSIFTAAALNGVAQRLLDASVQHALDREQFGVPIGSFQAVKHMLADIYVEIESNRPAAWYAARMLGGDEDELAIWAGVAKLLANRASKTASWHTLQVHGGVGYTWEHPLHIWMKRARALEEQWGSTRQLRRTLGDAVAENTDLVDRWGPSVG